MIHHEQCSPPLFYLNVTVLTKEDIFLLHRKQSKIIFHPNTEREKRRNKRKLFVIFLPLHARRLRAAMLQSRTRTSVISRRDLKEHSDLFLFLYFVVEERKITSKEMHLSCFSSWWGRAKEDKTAWSQLGHPDMLETA